MIYLLTAVGLSTGAVVQYTFISKQYIEQHKLQQNNTNNNQNFCYMIYLLTAAGLSPGCSSTVHIYTQTVHKTTQITTEQHK